MFLAQVDDSKNGVRSKMPGVFLFRYSFAKLHNPTKPELRIFTFQTFFFPDGDADKAIYFHCEVKICLKADKCKQKDKATCDGKRKRRSVDVQGELLFPSDTFIYLIGQNFGGQNCRKSDLLPNILSTEI